MAEFDLTSRMSPYLDRHLVFPLLEFLPEKGLYSENVSSKVILLTFIIECDVRCNPSVP